RGELDEALAAGREALPLLLEDGTAWIFVNDLALRAALAGRACDAARLAGYYDCTLAKQEVTSHPLQERLRQRLHSVLRQKFTTDELERLRTEGAKLTEAEACALALAS
ncbi:MAG TPA: hypothetical protein VF304_15015, partial [Casimicrobiaceae bacterium]